jgi:hypothetical protein
MSVVVDLGRDTRSRLRNARDSKESRISPLKASMPGTGASRHAQKTVVLHTAEED